VYLVSCVYLPILFFSDTYTLFCFQRRYQPALPLQDPCTGLCSFGRRRLQCVFLRLLILCLGLLTIVLVGTCSEQTSLYVTMLVPGPVAAMANTQIVTQSFLTWLLLLVRWTSCSERSTDDESTSSLVEREFSWEMIVAKPSRHNQTKQDERKKNTEKNK
jgi:hypothetical protein